MTSSCSPRHTTPQFKASPRRGRYAAAALVICLSIPSVVVFSSVASTSLGGDLIATPRGRVTLFNNGTPQLIARIATTPSSDRFFSPFLPMLPFLTAREQVSKYDTFVPGYTTTAQYQEACFSA